MVRDVHLSNVSGPTLGAFFTLAAAPVLGLALDNITLIAAGSSGARPGWTCGGGGGGGDGGGAAQVFACNGIDAMLTPPLAHPDGCALSCPRAWRFERGLDGP